MDRAFLKVSLLLSVCLLGSCGMQPSGGAQGRRSSTKSAEKSTDPKKSGNASAPEKCTTNTSTTGTSQTQTSVGSAADNTFLAARQAITDNCAGCHTATAPVLTSDEQMAANKSAIINSVKTGSMPPGGSISTADKEAIVAWSGAAFMLAGAVTYEGEIKAIINNKCAWCHSSTANPADRHSPYLTTYDQVKARFDSSMEEIQEGKMPPKNKMPQLEAGDAEKLQAWADGGFLQGEPVKLPDPAASVYYEGTIRKILADNCTGCHGQGGQPPVMNTYETAKASGKLSLADIEKGSMPKAGPLPAAEKEAFRKWVEAGMPLDENTPVDNSPTDGTTDSASGDNGSGTPADTGAGCN